LKRAESGSRPDKEAGLKPGPLQKKLIHRLLTMRYH
jgi:hypothetical protein